MDSMIKEINDNLKTILDTIKENRDSAISVLDNIQNQMDKKVEEAKKYKLEVDSRKETIKKLEEDNSNLEQSLSELNDKYGKMNLVSVIEAGNKEIKNKINDNLKSINKEKEQIAELTNKARTIKDLLINLKKDKNLKEEKLEYTKIVYDYYNDRLNSVIDYAFDHSNNLVDYKSDISDDNNYVEDIENSEEEIKNIELENTMVFDEIANIDSNDNFKDEMSFISDQIDNAIDSSDETDVDLNVEEEIDDTKEEISNIEKTPEDIPFDTEKFNEIIKQGMSEYPFDLKKDEENKEPSESTQIFDSIMNVDNMDINDLEAQDTNDYFEVDNSSEINEDNIFESDENNESVEKNELENISDEEVDVDDTLISSDTTLNNNENEENDDDNNQGRIDKINELFSTFNNNLNNNSTDDNNALTDQEVNTTEEVVPYINPGIDEQIDNAYQDIFGAPLEEKDLNKKEPTLTDIFGNPIKQEDLGKDVKIAKKLEDLFNENGIDFNKFREDEKNYLKQIYDEEKYTGIINVLKNNKIELDNIYNAFNIFGEIDSSSLDDIIKKLINIGQSAEAIGFILEKIPKVKKYNLDEAIASFGDYVNDIDITELIMKAKEIYDNGGNK